MKLDAYIYKIDDEISELKTKEEAALWIEQFNELLTYARKEVRKVLIKLPNKQ